MYIYRYGKPGSPVCIREYKGHSLAYDKSRKVPVWVMETLTKQDESSGEEANRKKSIFQVCLILVYIMYVHIYMYP